MAAMSVTCVITKGDQELKTISEPVTFGCLDSLVASLRAAQEGSNTFLTLAIKEQGKEELLEEEGEESEEEEPETKVAKLQ